MVRKSKLVMKVKNKVPIMILRIMRWILVKFPRWFGGLFVTTTYYLTYIFFGHQRDLCKRNIMAAYDGELSDKECADIARQCVKNVGFYMIDLVYYYKRKAALMDNTIIKNEHILKKALEAKKGAIVVSAHMANFPLMLIALSYFGYKVNIVIRPMRNPELSVFIHEISGAGGVNMIQTEPKKGFVKDSLKALRNNELLFILSDEIVTKGSGVEVDFFDGKVEKAIGPLIFQERTDSPVFSIYPTKNEENKFVLHVEELLDIEKKYDEKKNYEVNVGKLTKTLEKYVRRFPQQWGGWFNKRWHPTQ